MTSLSVGIQCNPRDVDCQIDIDDVDSAAAVPLIRSSSSRSPANRLNKNNQPNHLYLSAPDFSHAPELSPSTANRYGDHPERVPFHRDQSENILSSRSSVNVETIWGLTCD